MVWPVFNITLSCLCNILRFNSGINNTKHRFRVLVHNVSFNAKFSKIKYTPVHPSLTIYKTGVLRGSKLYGSVSRMVITFRCASFI